MINQLESQLPKEFIDLKNKIIVCKLLNQTMHTTQYTPEYIDQMPTEMLEQMVIVCQMSQ